MMFNCWPMLFVYDGRQQWTESSITIISSLSFLLQFLSKQYKCPSTDLVPVNSLVSNRISLSIFPLSYLSICPETTLKKYILSSLGVVYLKLYIGIVLAHNACSLIFCMQKCIAINQRKSWVKWYNPHSYFGKLKGSIIIKRQFG